MARRLSGRIAARASSQMRSAVHLARIATAPKAPKGEVRLSLGLPRVPGMGEVAFGGMVRNQRLQAMFPNEPHAFNVLYIGSSTRPADSDQQLWLARRRGAAVVWNQDGVAYPGWHPGDLERTNAPMRRGLQGADHVFYQSGFCRATASRFLGEPRGTWEVLPNAVDTSVFTPLPAPREASPLVLLLGGNQYEDYRLSSALETLAFVTKSRPDARLLVAGKLSWLPDPGDARRVANRWAAALGVADRVDWLGAFTQRDAPALYRRADVLLHTKYKDPCPSVVIEALACGLPVVYSDTGGVPELVGPDAGVPVAVEDRWDRQLPPDPATMAEAVLRVAEARSRFSVAARRRAVERFELAPWLARHRAVFEGLLRRGL